VIGTALQKNWRDDATNKIRLFDKCKLLQEKILVATVKFLSPVSSIAQIGIEGVALYVALTLLHSLME